MLRKSSREVTDQGRHYSVNFGIHLTLDDVVHHSYCNHVQIEVQCENYT